MSSWYGTAEHPRSIHGSVCRASKDATSRRSESSGLTTPAISSAIYISAESYHQHNPEAADGLDGFGAAAARWADAGKNLVYTVVHRVIAEGDLVLLQSEGEFGVPVAYWDLFRVAGGRIVEHWDVIAPVPAELPHPNGAF